MMSPLMKMTTISNWRWMRGSKTSRHKDVQRGLPPAWSPKTRQAQWLDQAGKRPARQGQRARRRRGGGVWGRELWLCTRSHSCQTSWRWRRRGPQTCESEPKVSFTTSLNFPRLLDKYDGQAEKWKKNHLMYNLLDSVLRSASSRILYLDLRFHLQILSRNWKEELPRYDLSGPWFQIINNCKVLHLQCGKSLAVVGSMWGKTF